MNDTFKEKAEEQIIDALRDVYTKGLVKGAATVCETILMIIDNECSDADKVESVKELCGNFIAKNEVEVKWVKD